jgi:phage terminase large subunit GpA-like protein
MVVAFRTELLARDDKLKAEIDACTASTSTSRSSMSTLATPSHSSLDTTPAVRSLVRAWRSKCDAAGGDDDDGLGAERRRMSPKATARPGVYNPDLTPWVPGIHEALDDPAVHEVVCMKSAQVAWTDGVLLNYIGRRIDIDPCPMIVMFAKDGAAKEFNDEKFEPMVEVTPCLAAKIPITRSATRTTAGSSRASPAAS